MEREIDRKRRKRYKEIQRERKVIVITG